MFKERKPEFIYIKSDSLNMEIALSKKSGIAYCEDRVTYSPQEIDLFFNAGKVIDLSVHNTKKTFGGEVTSIENSAEPGASREGELDIF